VGLAGSNAFAEESELAAGAKSLDLVDGNSELAGHVAIEDDVAGSHALELAGELIAVGEDEYVRRLGGSWLGGGLGESQRGEGEKGEEKNEVSAHGVSFGKVSQVDLPITFDAILRDVLLD
jgi:hypothetical protein